VEKSVQSEDGSQFFLSVVHLGELGLDEGLLRALRRRIEESDFVNLCKLVHHLDDADHDARLSLSLAKIMICRRINRLVVMPVWPSYM